MSILEDMLEQQLSLCGISGFEREYQFVSWRKWRFDFAWVDEKLAVEVEGGVWSNGRHTRGAGFIGDMEKYNMAVLHGWRVLRYSSDEISRGEALKQIERALGLVKDVDDGLPF